MPRFTMKWVEREGGYYSVRRDGRQIGGHRNKDGAEYILAQARRKERLKKK